MKHALVPWAGFLLASTAALAQPQITFQDATVTASGITAGGQVAFYGVAHEFGGTRPSIRRWARVLVDEGATGTVALELGQLVPTHSVWFAVDVGTGRTAVSSPRPALVRRVAATGPGVGNSPNGPSTTFRTAGPMLDFFVVRPASGSWVFLSVDGGAGDEDGAVDGGVTFLLQRATAVGESPQAPASFITGDLVVSVDPLSFKFSEVETQ
jgi:hypothetical protein